jgi:D-tagatose-bisphosphate aldolase class II non-catalytic subunit
MTPPAAPSQSRTSPLARLGPARQSGRPRGITSVCSAHQMVIEAALLGGLARRQQDGTAAGEVLIEATCNQVNQEGGYTGMTPTDFHRFVLDIAQRLGFDAAQLILGGDHLGPNPWRHLPAEEAMARAGAMIDAYVRAGFAKIHLDASMACRGESEPLATELIAERAATLAAIAERAAEATGASKPVYVIGTEVPIPGGAMEELTSLQVTKPAAATETIEAHRRAFAARGLNAAFERVIGLVVQPGVEFGNANVIRYERDKAQDLGRVLDQMPQLVFEAHSTDYQPQPYLAELVQDGFAILKVGPALTFALREAFYGLDLIASNLDGAPVNDGVQAVMERLMLQQPGNWEKYYHGSEAERRVLRHFSYSDRIRYYWPQPQAVQAIDRLFARLGDKPIPETLVSQYLAALYPKVASGAVKPTAQHLLIAAVDQVLADYASACQPLK